MRIATILLLTFILSASAYAEQFFTIGDHQVHYSVIPTTFLKPDIAANYGITRGRDRALVNISVLNANQQGVTANITGESKNLLSQIQSLSFKQVNEQDAIYYLALLQHGDEETHRLRIVVTLEDGRSGELEFQQKLYWDR